MKMSVLLNVFLAVAVGVLAVKVFMPGGSENSASNQVLGNIMPRGAGHANGSRLFSKNWLPNTTDKSISIK